MRTFTIIPRKLLKINNDCSDKMIFEKYKLFTMVKLTNIKHTNVIIDIVVIIFIHVYFPWNL